MIPRPKTIYQIHAFKTRDAYFWATHSGAELDLMIPIAGKRHGFEFKYADAPGKKRSMHIAIEDLGLEHLWVIYPIVAKAGGLQSQGA